MGRDFVYLWKQLFKSLTSAVPQEIGIFKIISNLHCKNYCWFLWNKTNSKSVFDVVKTSWRKKKGFTMYAILFPYLLLLWCCEVIHEMDQWISSLNFSFYPSQWDKVAAKPCNGKLDWKSDFCTHHWWDWNYSSWSSASQPITFSQSHLFINSLIFFSMADTKIHTAMIHLANCTLLWRQELLPLDPCQVISKCPWARGYFFYFFISFFLQIPTASCKSLELIGTFYEYQWLLEPPVHQGLGSHWKKLRNGFSKAVPDLETMLSVCMLHCIWQTLWQKWCASWRMELVGSKASRTKSCNISDKRTRIPWFPPSGWIHCIIPFA